MASSYGTCIVGELPRSLWLIGELSTCPLFEALAPYYHSRSQPPPNSWLCTGAATNVRVEKIGTSLDGPAAAPIGMRSFDGLAAAETRRRAAPGSPLTATFPSTPPPGFRPVAADVRYQWPGRSPAGGDRWPQYKRGWIGRWAGANASALAAAPPLTE
jgi:hypothetical protein